MIHILQIGFSHNPGGVENCIMNYYRHIDKTKFSFDFLDLYGEGIAYRKEIITLGGKVIVLPNYKKYPITAAKKLYWLIKNSDYKIVHIHMQSAANLMPILAAIKSEKVKIIAHSHSSNTPKGLLRKSLNRVNIPIIRKLKIEKWACGYKAGLWMWGKSFDKCNIMENALEYENYKYNLTIRKRIRNECGFPESAKVIGFIGRFGAEKNIFFLIKVLKELVQLSSDFRLLTVGGNDLYNAFWDKLLEEGLKQYYYSAGIQGDSTMQLFGLWYCAALIVNVLANEKVGFLFYLSIFMIGMGIGGSANFTTSLPTSIFGRQGFDKVNSVIFPIQGLVTACCFLVNGIVTSVIGNLKMAYIIFAVVAILNVLLVTMVNEHKYNKDWQAAQK